MKKLLLIAVLVSGMIGVNAQDFQGKISYVCSYYSKTKGINDLQWANMLGNRLLYYYKNGNYKTTTNGSLVEWSLYINKDNTIYNKLANSDTIYWENAAIIKNLNDTVVQVIVKRKALNILGYMCDEVTACTSTGEHKYYYSSRFRVDPKLFLKHNAGNMAALTKLTKSLPLKMIVEYPQFTLECFAIDVKPLPLTDDVFKLDKGVLLRPMP